MRNDNTSISGYYSWSYLVNQAKQRAIMIATYSHHSKWIVVGQLAVTQSNRARVVVERFNYTCQIQVLYFTARSTGVDALTGYQNLQVLLNISCDALNQSH